MLIDGVAPLSRGLQIYAILKDVSEINIIFLTVGLSISLLILSYLFCELPFRLYLENYDIDKKPVYSLDVSCNYCENLPDIYSGGFCNPVENYCHKLRFCKLFMLSGYYTTSSPLLLFLSSFFVALFIKTVSTQLLGYFRY